MTNRHERMSRAFARPSVFAAAWTIAVFLMTGGPAGAEQMSHALGPHPRIPSTPAEPVRFSEDNPFALGRSLYGTHCITCHGAHFEGSDGVPSLKTSGGAPVDFYVGTGRMPALAKDVQAIHQHARFTQAEIDALNTYISRQTQSFTAIPHVVPDDALLQHGRNIYAENCQACHGAGAQGASAGDRWIALPLSQANPKQIGEAIRIGPGVMPRFTSAQLSDRDISAVATYIAYVTKTPQTYGGATMDYLGPAAEGLVGALLGVGGLFWVIYFTGTKADGTRRHKK